LLHKDSALGFAADLKFKVFLSAAWRMSHCWGGPVRAPGVV